MKNPAPQSARGSDESWKILHGSLAVFNVEQVALNRHEQYFKDNAPELSHSRSNPVNHCHKKAQKSQKNLWRLNEAPKARNMIARGKREARRPW
jgi:hypothetical protein